MTEVAPWLPASVVADARGLAMSGGGTVTRLEDVVMAGTAKVVSVTIAAVDGSQNLATVLAQDVTRRVMADRARDRRAALSAGVLQAASAVQRAAELEDVLREAARAAFALSGAVRAACLIDEPRPPAGPAGYVAERGRPGRLLRSEAGMPPRGVLVEVAGDHGSAAGRIVVWPPENGVLDDAELDAMRDFARFTAPVLRAAADAHAEAAARARAAVRLDRERLAADVRRTLAGVLDESVMTKRVVDMVVPRLADCCVVDLGATTARWRRAAGKVDGLLSGLVDVEGSASSRAPRQPVVHTAPPAGVMRRIAPPPAFAEVASLSEPVRSASAPIRAGRTTIGSVHAVTTRLSGRLLDDDDVDCLAEIADALGEALLASRRYGEERRLRLRREHERDRAEMLTRAASRLNAAPDLDTTLDNVPRTALGVADACVVELMLEDETIRRTAAAEDTTVHERIGRLGGLVDDPEAAERLRRAADGPRYARDGEARSLERLEADRPVLDAIEFTSTVQIPLGGTPGTVGLLTLLTVGASGRTLTEADVGWATELADHVAAALENALLYERQRRAAGTLQHSLLPDHLPSVAGLEFAARYMPAGEGVDVGGDWYDVWSLADGSAVAVVGDVMGRGVKAAAAMAQLRHALRAYAFEGHGPAEAVGLLNRLVRSRLPDQLATVVYATVSPTGHVSVVCAGHPPPLLAYPNGSVAILDSGRGPALGVVDAAYEAASFVAPPGSVLALFTDGLVEDRQTSFDDGLRRLREAMRSVSGSLDLTCDRVIVRGIEQRTLDDDAALLAVRIGVAGAGPTGAARSAVRLRKPRSLSS